MPPRPSKRSSVWRKHKAFTAPERLSGVRATRFRLHFERRAENPRKRGPGAKLRLHRGDAVSGGNKHSDERTPRHIPGVQVAFRVLMIRWILQFALRIAFRCVLHRCGSQDIRR